jgi:hypothetical protein
MKEDEDVGLNSKFPMVTWKPNNLGISIFSVSALSASSPLHCPQHFPQPPQIRLVNPQMCQGAIGE